MLSVTELKKQRSQDAAEINFNPAFNYIGAENFPEFFKYPLWFPFGKYLNFPAAKHDRRFQDESRTTKNNKLMLLDFSVELILDGVEPWSFKYWFALTWFGIFIFPLITIIGRVIDKE